MVVQPGESMTPDACPFCGAPKRIMDEGADYVRYACGSVVFAGISAQDPECARYVRTRISQLRRMAEACEVRFERWSNGSVLAETRFPEWWIHRRNDQYRRVASACLREITRLQEAQRGTA